MSAQAFAMFIVDTLVLVALICVVFAEFFMYVFSRFIKKK